jgi:4-diphosphocytidyl-2-C-methyl-D-erythritol kinase
MGAGPDLKISAWADAANFDDAIISLAAHQNDLEPAAISTVPQIGTTLEALRNLPDVRLVRMSGSGATCFALFKHLEQAIKAQSDFAKQTGMWAKAGLLNPQQQTS